MKLKLALFFAGCMSVTSLFSQQSKRLNDNWEFVRMDLGGVWEAVRPVGKGNPEEMPVWEKVQLPHCMNARDAVDPDVNYYQGPGWYRTLLNIDNPYNNGRTMLHFEGSGQKTDVYVYSTKVGTHVGGYDEFTVDITDAVAAFKNSEVFNKQFKGKVPVVIRTDNSRDLEMIPSSLSDFTVYGGIYRYLNLVYTPALSVQKIFALPEVDKTGKTGKLQVKARFYDPGKMSLGTASVRLFDPSGKLVQQSKKDLTSLSEDALLSEYNIKSPVLWSTDDPKLYTIEVMIFSGADSSLLREKIGFRHAEFVTKGPFMLNGKRLLLNGTHRHEDHAGVGAAMTEEMIRAEMKLMKDMGANFIRLGHYQQSRIVLNLCDSLGLLVWEEIPWCRGGLGGDIYKEQARRMLTNMIEQHYNHPSVILWGLGNENDWPGDFPEFDQQKIRTFMKELHDLSHKLDNSRLTSIRRCDFCKDIVDVYSPSIWAGWYRGVYTEYKAITEAEYNKTDHFFHAEWGGDSHAGRHSESPDKSLQQIRTGNGGDERAGDASLFGGAARVSKDGDWSESYIVNLFDWHLKEQETMPWLTGSAQWVFKDFATPIRPDNPTPYVNQKGVIERDLTPKESYYVFQSYWTTKPMVHIYGHSWPVRWGDEGEAKVVKVYSNCDEAELWVNGKSLGVRKRNSRDFPAAGLRWDVVFNNGNNNVKVIARKKKVQVEDFIQVQYQTEKWNKPSKMIVEKISEQDGIATIQVKAVDDKGVQCLDAAQFIRFGLIGDGMLIDDLGTSGGSRYVQLYNGRALIRVNTNKGKSKISVQSKGLPTAFFDL